MQDRRRRSPQHLRLPWYLLPLRAFVHHAAPPPRALRDARGGEPAIAVGHAVHGAPLCRAWTQWFSLCGACGVTHAAEIAVAAAVATAAMVVEQTTLFSADQLVDAAFVRQYPAEQRWAERSTL